MARGINKVILVGNVGNEPEIKRSVNGSLNASLSLATNEIWKDQNGNQQTRTEWHRVTIFGKAAEIVEQYVRKGTMLYIEGSLQTSRYTDKNNIERFSTSVIVGGFSGQLQILSSQGDHSNPSNNNKNDYNFSNNYQAPISAPPMQEADFDDDDEIPF